MRISFRVNGHSSNLREFAKQHWPFGETEKVKDLMNLLLMVIWNISQYAFIRLIQRFRQSVKSRLGFRDCVAVSQIV